MPSQTRHHRQTAQPECILCLPSVGTQTHQTLLHRINKNGQNSDTTQQTIRVTLECQQSRDHTHTQTCCPLQWAPCDKPRPQLDDVLQRSVLSPSWQSLFPQPRSASFSPQPQSPSLHCESSASPLLLAAHTPVLLRLSTHDINSGSNAITAARNGDYNWKEHMQQTAFFLNNDNNKLGKAV